MNEIEFFDVLSKNINYIIVDDMILRSGTFEIKIQKNGNYHTKELYHNSSKIKLKNTKVNYDCLCGNKDITILLKRYLSKKTLKCRICKEDSFKNKKQSEYMRKSFELYGKIKPLEKLQSKKISNKELIKKSKFLFETENLDFKNNYFKTHLSANDHNKIKKFIFFSK